MTKRQYCFLIVTLLLFSRLSAQVAKDSVSVVFDLRWKSEKLQLGKSYSSNNDSLQLSLMKFYISNFEIEYHNKSIDREKNSYHLIDIENLKSLHFMIPKSKKEISNINFNIGIDSTTSVSGALAGDLDVQNGMYWAWQSGYINMKVEGTSKSCKTRKNAFQFHIGGYLNPNYALRKVNFKFNSNSKNQIVVVIDLNKLFSEINLADTNSIMIPGEKAMKIADLSAKMFSIE